MIKGVVVQGPSWELHEAILQPLFFLHMTSDMLGGQRSGEGPDPMTSNMKAKGLNCITIYMLGGKKDTLGVRSLFSQFAHG